MRVLWDCIIHYRTDYFYETDRAISYGNIDLQHCFFKIFIYYVCYNISTTYKLSYMQVHIVASNLLRIKDISKI